MVELKNPALQQLAERWQLAEAETLSLRDPSLARITRARRALLAAADGRQLTEAELRLITWAFAWDADVVEPLASMIAVPKPQPPPRVPHA